MPLHKSLSRISPRRHRKCDTQEPLQPLFKLWILRYLVALGGHRDFVRGGDFSSDELAFSLGLGKWVDNPELEYNAKAIRLELRAMHQQAERKLAKEKEPEALGVNIRRVQALVGLTDVERSILTFAVLLKQDSALNLSLGRMDKVSTVNLFRVLSQLLNLEVEAVKEALHSDTVLIRSGLLTICRQTADLDSKLELISEQFADVITTADTDPLQLLKGIVVASAAPSLQLEDYAHIQEQLDVLLPYLKLAVEQRKIGVNIFIYGAPGTGKSELSRLLAQVVGAELFEIASEDDDGDPIGGVKRLRALHAAQSFFVKGKSILMFDEAEDVYRGGGYYGSQKSTAQEHKAWVNRALEQNPVPAIWVSNSASCMDAAFLRRYDMVIRLPIPPKKQREKIITHACHGMLDSERIKRISEVETLSPAVITRGAAVISSIREELGHEKTGASLELLINSTLRSQGHGQIPKSKASLLPDIYDPSLIEVDMDVLELAKGIVAAKSARICFYGPPGTGKTAYCRWLAEQLDRPLMIKRYSDLSSKWLGESEQNIAKAFEQATKDEAILLIDEVDSFLQDRRGAQRSWEVTQVNEMLTQMETFPGIFVASTNLMDNLDQAALRRFDMKIRFGYLQAKQSGLLLQRWCEALGLADADELQHARLARLHNLTPGDFAAAARAHRFKPFKSAHDLVRQLEEDCGLKEDGNKHRIGFV